MEFYKVDIPGPYPQGLQFSVTEMEVSNILSNFRRRFLSPAGPVPIIQNSLGVSELCERHSTSHGFFSHLSTLQAWNGCH